MNYKRIYVNLISNALGRITIGYKEVHHIIPLCMNGSNDPANLVDLTPEEHFLAHQLLIKIYPNEPKLVLAARYMCYDSNGQRINNKMFGWLRRKHSEAMSVINKGRVVSPELAKRRGDSQKGRIGPMKGKAHKEESRKKTSTSLIGRKKPPRTEEHKKNHGDSIRGKNHTDETKRKISESTKGKSFEERYGKEESERRKEIYRKAWEVRKFNKTFPESLLP